ncbi:primosomal protein N' [Denitrovibrio acetiphilus DSM 12809]|uniref:Replication restart protein PriA n=1 Tax=Denitrovibrio acetiphilus (strain DSM 12809 / NBRC 114555 / N2460) TaxID=522772 RepID=D4H7G3_DENA2|nr:primosomal protein N' [Denitrovibrio acetiphilus]ADD67962.1 primosomal protein N' [Denitrovibrio acetiphilus DSM 12809]
MKYYDVILPVPTGGIYTYTSEDEIQNGVRATVPLGRRTLTGIVLRENTAPDESIKYRNISTVHDTNPIFSCEYMDLIMKISEYYCAGAGQVLKGVISEQVYTSEKTTVEIKHFEPKELTLNEAQLSVYNGIYSSLKDGFSTHLVHGVTGSGKTEIFIELAKKVIAEGKQVLYLVPEISLTPQLENRLSARMGFDVLSYHSKKTPKKRKEAFWSFSAGTLPMMLGARSSLFVPAKEIGLIIVDEEHESSYKQDEIPSYQLRDMSVLYGKILKIPVILASATPSLESWANAKSGKYLYHSIPCRPDTDMPEIQIVDMKEEEPIGGILSIPLYDAIYETINRGEQVILLINRKGYSHTLYCRKCGNIINCSNCSVAVTYYKSTNTCKCNYCSQEVRRPKCLHCGSDDITDYGAGTEKVAEVLETAFEKKILRLDTENVKSYKKLSEMLKSFEDGEYPIMAGTQLVAKGLDFGNVTLAGIINIDNMFTLPDFRANERAYQLLLQLAGRAGRADKKGRVVIQTAMPELDLFKRLDCLDTTFYEMEMARRKLFNYPPFYKMCRITLSHTKEEAVKDAAFLVYDTLLRFKNDAEVFYPAQAPIYKIQNRFRYGIIIKSPLNSELSKLIRAAANTLKDNAKTTLRIKIDRDPHFFM